MQTADCGLLSLHHLCESVPHSKSLSRCLYILLVLFLWGTLTDTGFGSERHSRGQHFKDGFFFFLSNFVFCMGYVCVSVKSLSCVPLCDPMDCGPPGSSVRGILQARILGWVARLPSRGSSPPRDRTCVSYVSCIGRQVLYH